MIYDIFLATSVTKMLDHNSTAACFIAEVLIMGNENYIQNPKLQNEQMKDENEVFNSFINVMVQIVEKYGKTVLQELDCAA